jgi:hypothetical protein
MLAGEVLKVMETASSGDVSHLTARIQPVELPFRPFPPPEEAESEVERLRAELAALEAAGAAHGEIRRAITRVEGAEGQALMARELEGQRSRHTQVQVLDLEAAVLVGLPGEPFTRTVLEVKERSCRPYTAVVSYANDECGYFPDAASIAVGTYEALISPYGADAAERLRDTALSLLRER